jgi:DNA-binding YbaB/EbfC family protein
MLGGLGNLTAMLKQAKEMKGRLEQMQAEAANLRFTGEAGGGAVVATVDGRGCLVDIKIKPEATSDVELLEDLIKAAAGAAVAKWHQGMKSEMAKLTGGVDIPGLSDLFGSAGPPGEGPPG